MNLVHVMVSFIFSVYIVYYFSCRVLSFICVCVYVCVCVCLHLHEIIEGLYFYVGLSVCLSVCLSVSVHL